jgi:serine protease Do
MSNDYEQNNRPEEQAPQTGSWQQPGDSYTGNSQYNGGYHYTAGNIPGQEQRYYNSNPNPNMNQNPNPMAGYNVTPRQPEKKPKKTGVIALALVCVLVGGAAGGAAVGLMNRSSNTADAAEPASTVEAAAEEETSAEPETTEEALGNINSTVIDVTTNSKSTTMTPQDVYENYVNAVVAIANEATTTNVYGQVSVTASSGSGFIISQDGYIVTNNHVVEDAQTLTVIMTSGEEYEATIIGADEQNDVALIKIDATGLPTVSIGDSDDIEVGQQVCAIGNPLGELTNTLTVGYVSALDREINENGTPINMFQTDCAINSGNSGGPIFDMNGNVIGITTAKYSSSGSSTTASIEGIGFCIPSNDAMDIVSDLLEYGYVKGRPYLGITCQAISSTVTQYYNLPSGIYVNSVESGSAAEDAGLQQGDIITALDGTEVDSVTDFKALLKNYSAGDTATLTVYRSASGTVELSVTFGEQVTTTSSQTEETEEDTQDQQDQQQQQQPQQQNPWSYYGFGDMS